MKISNVENQYAIIFHRSVWPEELREIHLFEKSFEQIRCDVRKNARKSLNMGLNGSAMSAHGLRFDEDGAISCPMPLDALPTPFKTFFGSF